MKRLIFSISAFILLSVSVYSAEVVWQKRTYDGLMQYHIKCSNGKIVDIFYYPSSQRYHYDGHSWSSLQKAVNNNCR